MNASQNDPFAKLFTSGTHWFRADFHLHTQADRQFRNSSPEVNFAEAYIDRLSNEGISIGLITNHNKFDKEEFKQLRKVATKKQIFMLPGVELGIQGGKGGIHALICFDPERWIDNKEQIDFINRFLDNAFDQCPNRESKDTICRWTLGQLLDELKRHEDNGRRSFVILAHVDQNKGALKELGSSIGGFFNDAFQHFVLGFQKVRNRDNWNNLKQWLSSDWKPAQVEGSDCKSLDAVGVAHKEGIDQKEVWIKLGSLSFVSIRLALQMKENRVSPEPPARQHAFVRSMTLEGKLIRQQKIELSPDMTNLIGIRGSGKSSLLECFRYALDLRLSEQTDVAGYKESLVERTLGSGGKITLDLVDCRGDVYQVERVLRESPKVSRCGEYIPNLKPTSTSLINARYFGQKDLVLFSEKGFGGELVKRFSQTDPAESEAIRSCANQIERRVLQLDQGRTQLEQQEDFESQLAEANELLKKFNDLNLGEKLSQQIALEKDLKHGKDLVKRQEETIKSLQSWLDEEETLWDGWMNYGSASRDPLYIGLAETSSSFVNELRKGARIVENLQSAHGKSVDQLKKLESHYEKKKEEFAAVRRELELPGDLSPDTYIKVTKKKELLEAKLKEIAALKSNRNQLYELLQNDLKQLQDLWHDEYKRKIRDIERLNKCESSLQIKLGFKQEKTGFVANLKAWSQGLQGKTLERIAEHFSDGIELYRDLSHQPEKLKTLGLNPDQIVKIKEGINANLREVLTYRPEDSVLLEYKGKSSMLWKAVMMLSEGASKSTNHGSIRAIGYYFHWGDFYTPVQANPGQR